MIKKLLCLLAVLLLSVSWAQASSRGIMVKLKASERMGAADVGSVNLYSKSYALVIGIDNYHAGWPRLGKAVEDARAITRELRAKGFEVTLKTDLDSIALQQEFKKFFAIKGADPEARLLLWYAGHGHTINGEGYLVPADAPPAVSPAFKVSAIPMRDFGSLVRMANAKHVLSIFDSCFSGTVFQARAGAAPAAITKKTIKPVREFLTSGDAGQQVRDDGSFRKYFIRALNGEERADVNGDGYVTGQELGLFMSQSMSDLTNAAQTPKFGKLQDVNFNQGDYVFQLAQGAVVESMPQAGHTAAKLRILTRPNGAMVYADGVQQGSAPLILSKLKGRVVISAKKAGYADASERIRIRPGKSQKITLLLDRVITTGSIRILSTPTGAKWYLDGDYMGITPDTATDIEPGSHRIKVAQQGLHDWQQSLRVRKGKTSELVATLNKSVLTHALTINATPADARIRILNIGPKYSAGMQLKPGSYHIEVSSSGYVRQDAWIELGNDDLTHSMTLKKRAVKALVASSTTVASIEMVRIPSGSFQMGSNGGLDNEKPTRRVSIGSFKMGKYEVTNTQYMAFVNATGTHAPEWMEVGSQYNIRTGTDNYYKKLGLALSADRQPVVGVSWNDAVAYARWLSNQTGQRFRLPTEAEWEYAARAGTSSKWSWGNRESSAGSYAWYGQNSGRKTHPVGQKQANSFGLYDMHGNVWEWVQDVYHDNYKGAPSDGSAWEGGGSKRVLRGGSWYFNPNGMRSAYRYRNPADFRSDDIGFRLVQD